MPTREAMLEDDDSDGSPVGEKQKTTDNNKKGTSSDSDEEMKDFEGEQEATRKTGDNPFSDGSSDGDEKTEKKEEEKKKKAATEDNQKPPEEEKTAAPTAAAVAADSSENKTNDNNIFDADSSDEEDDNKKKEQPNEASPQKKPSIHDSDDDDDDEEIKKKPEEKKTNTADLGLDDSSEDDEPEFDDAGDVTGTGHNKGFQRKVSQQKTAVERAREQEEAEARREQEESPKPQRPRAPKVDPRTTVVLDPELPPSSASFHITKLPNLVGIQPYAFDPTTYLATAEEEEYRGYVHDMIRWRYKRGEDGELARDDDGKLIRESNARLVQWEDGSYTLHVGKEAFEVENIDSSLTVGTSDSNKVKFAGLNGYLYLSQVATHREKKAVSSEKKAEDDEEKDKMEEEEKKEEVEETPAGTILECMGAIGSRFIARPSSLRSEAHKSLTVAVRQKTIKKARIAEVVTQEDPEKAKMERIKVKQDLEKANARKRSYGEPRYGRAAPRHRPGMNRSYLEQDDGDYDTVNIRAMKRRTMDADDEDMDDYGDSDEDDEEEAMFNRRPKKGTTAEAKKKKASLEDDSDDDDDEELFGDDDDDEVVAPVKSHKKRAHQAVVDDDDSDWSINLTQRSSKRIITYIWIALNVFILLNLQEDERLLIQGWSFLRTTDYCIERGERIILAQMLLSAA